MVHNFYRGVSYILFWVVVVLIGISIILYNYTVKKYKAYSYLDGRLHLESTSFVHKGSPHTVIDLTRLVFHAHAVTTFGSLEKAAIFTGCFIYTKSS